MAYVKSGRGTIGGLIYDPAIYENVRTIVGTVSRSKILRALIAHGYRPVLATGRSLAEVRDRCAVFGLAGGVAEYGSALVCAEEAVDLLPPDARALLEAIRGELGDHPGVNLDTRYRFIVRARAAGGGPLPAKLIAGLASAARPEVRMVHGQGQTDFVWAGTDKGSGLRELAGRLSASACALAVGDSTTDLPLFECAALARAPRNARLGAGATGSGSPGTPTRRAWWTPAARCSATAPASARPATRRPSPRGPRRCWRSSTCARTAWLRFRAGPSRWPDG